MRHLNCLDKACRGSLRHSERAFRFLELDYGGVAEAFYGVPDVTYVHEKSLKRRLYQIIRNVFLKGEDISKTFPMNKNML